MLTTFDISERVDVIFSRARREGIEWCNEEVRQNGVTLKIVSEALLYLRKQELRQIGSYRRLFFDVNNTVSGMLQERFHDCKDFAFLDLVNPHCFITWKNSVPAKKLELLERRYGPLCKLSSLKQQLLFIYRDSDFHKATSQELLDYINNLNLQISEVFKLLLLKAIIAISSSSIERSFSCVKGSKTYLRNRMEQDRLGCLC